jgi:FkbM family methyltransferase
MSHRAFPASLVLGLILVCGAPAPARGQAATAPAAKARKPASAAQAKPVTFSCPDRGAFSRGPRYFSQFYEDYVLAYVFQGTPKGTYVDVGANDPDDWSVTKHFYLKGWRGVNIEPNLDLLAVLKARRPEDANLGVGISDEAAELTFYKFEQRANGLSTFDPEIAARHKASGYSYEELTVPVVTLTDALARSGTVSGGFDFLNIDVEGFERRVLRGLDFRKHSPRVIMLEATEPLTEVPTQNKWEDLLFAKGYTFAFDDGLNRYYVHRTETELQTRFLEAAYCVARDKRAKGIKLDGFTAEPR